ncbi:MAG: phosphoribosylanthranilate isomerase [Hydrocarboniphaga sp.]|uniref:phosphoribosylanthranilate isomerase n=1 Tax=Hydrocarboniphaga sp. TaxID=2033016 RepID=UPI002638964E|nr:phosphoribosylanthranilate isomerase [Hydrocarboniphaga sp.]MDB5968093.1 phosphoribosylanthranilate isomerase [Hydrocarboniphaga sp.]
MPTRIPTRIKFCGFTRAEDLDIALSLGVDAVGLIFDSRSQRVVSLAAAAELRRRVPVFVSVVALFRDADEALVAEVIDRIEPDLLQFHGQESPLFCERWARPYLKAVPMAESQDLEDWCRRYSRARGLLLDSHAPGALGGTGHRFDWSRSPRGLSKSWVLAGGLSPVNVAQAVTMAAPPAVDVSSGIESAPGIKDPALMRAFVDAVRRADLQSP